jgi:hypothetical protein
MQTTMHITLTETDLQDIQKKALYKCYFNFFNIGLALFSDKEDTFAAFKEVYKNFVCPSLPETYLTFYIMTQSKFYDGPCLIQHSGCVFFLPKKRIVSGLAEQIIFTRLIALIENYLLIHAAVVSKEGNGYIIIAPSGFGKTTLVLELLSRGYKFLSDEFCLIKMSNFYIDPFPRRLGVKANSPFRNLINKEKAIYLEFEEKYFIECTDIAPDGYGSQCKPKNLILLVDDIHGRADKKSSACYFDLMLLNQNQNPLEMLSHYPDVEMAHETLTHGYITYRFRAHDIKPLMTFYQDIWRRFENDILGVAASENNKPDFTKPPEIKKMLKSEAIFEMLTHVINRAPETQYLKKFDGKVSALLLTVGNFIKDINCYFMKPGRLSDMGDMIDRL